MGSFVLTLPLALLALWIFHGIVKLPTAKLLPEAIQRRLQDNLGAFRFGGAARFLLIIASILLGIATHLLWDSFTHSTTWPYRHWAVLRQSFALPIAGQMPLYKLLQHGSTIVGMGILSVWLLHWYRTSQPSAPLENQFSPQKKAAIVALVTAIALVGAFVRAVVGIGMPVGHVVFSKFVIQAVVTAMALFWWQLVAYGIASKPAGVTAPAIIRFD